MGVTVIIGVSSRPLGKEVRYNRNTAKTSGYRDAVIFFRKVREALRQSVEIAEGDTLHREPWSLRARRLPEY